MSSQSDRLSLAAAGLMVILCASWGLNHPIMKWMYRDVSPLLSAALRSIIAVAALMIYARIKGIQLRAPHLPWHHCLILGGFFSVEFVLLYIGFDLTLASRGAVFLYLQPVFTALGAHYFIPGDRLNLGRSIGLAVAFIGAAWVLTGGPEAGRASLAGDIMCVLGGVMWAGINVYTRAQLVGRVSFHTGLFWQLGPSIPILLAASFFLETPRLDVTWGFVGGMAYQALAVAFVSYLLFYMLLYRYPASKLAAFTFLTPVFGVLFSNLLMDDPLHFRLLGGLVLVSAGVWLVNRR